jgi:hypothetical protein
MTMSNSRQPCRLIKKNRPMGGRLPNRTAPASNLGRGRRFPAPAP